MRVARFEIGRHGNGPWSQDQHGGRSRPYHGSEVTAQYAARARVMVLRGMIRRLGLLTRRAIGMQMGQSRSCLGSGLRCGEPEQQRI